MHAALRHLAPLATASMLTGLAAQETGQQKPEDAPVTKQDVLDILKETFPVKITGGTFLWHYQPFLDDVDPNTEIYWAYLRFDVDMPGDVDFHLETMFRDKKLRAFFNSNVWIQECYLDWKPKESAHGHLKVGKIYSKFGQFWDGSFYGNVPYFDGLKLDPDLGLSYEHKFKMGKSTEVETSVQYFAEDGRTNGSLPGRDTLGVADISTPPGSPTSYGSRQRDSFVARFAPTFGLGEDTSLTLGASGMVFRADFFDQEDDTVVRWGADASLTAGAFSVFGDLAWQRGVSAPGHPRAGIREDSIFYVMSGTTYGVTDWLTLGYNFSYGDYDKSALREVFHMPRVVFKLTKHAEVWVEYVNWVRSQSGPDVDFDDSLNLVFYANF